MPDAQHEDFRGLAKPVTGSKTKPASEDAELPPEDGEETGLKASERDIQRAFEQNITRMPPG